jgi:hypothetical protein
LAGNVEKPPVCGRRRANSAIAPFAIATAIAIGLNGCVPSTQIVKEAVYIDRPCDQARDFAPVVWIPARWIAVKINGIEHVATPDGAVLLGALLRLKAHTNTGGKGND